MNTLDLISKITNEKKLRFLELYPKCNCMLTKTAEAMGVSWQSVYYWINTDSMFSEAFEGLKKDLELKQEEYYVNKINSIVDSDKTPPQTQLLGSFFMLKALNPRYKDKVQDINVSGDIIVQSSIPRPVVEAVDKPKQLC